MDPKSVRAWAVFGIPFALSLCLSLSTLGSTVAWQDSGFFLTAVKDLGVLYAPGFVLYLLLCKAWTLLLFFVDVTVAIHLFASLCAALAAGVLAVAARGMLVSRGRVFGSSTDDVVPALADAAGIAAGVLAASGYTFWAAAIYAKGYSFYYLLLALLLWRMVRADASGEGRDFAIVAALIGLCWQGHPSATLAGAAMLLFVAVHARRLGLRPVAACVGVAATCALAPSLALPVLASRDPALMFADPRTVGDVLRMLTGSHFLTGPGSMGLDASRVRSVGIYFWEEYLVVGSLAILAGLLSMVGRRRRTLLFAAAWSIPYTVGTVLFRIEGQHDHWFVAAWMPLVLVAGAGFARLGALAGAHGQAAVAGAALVVAGGSVALNRADLNQREYRLGEMFARIYLEPLEPRAILLLASDDSAGGTHYLQVVRGVQPEVVLVRQGLLAKPWYRDWLGRRHPFLKFEEPVTPASFANANASAERPVYFEVPAPERALRPDLALVPAGTLWKTVPKGEESLDGRYWKFPIEPEDVRARFRRARAQAVIPYPGGLIIHPEPYERRLMIVLLRARRLLADWHHQRKNFEAAGRLYASILACDPEAGDLPDIVYPLATSYLALGRAEQAEPLLRRTVEIGAPPRIEAAALAFLGELRRSKGDEAGAAGYFERALAVRGLEEEFRAELQRRAGPR